MQPNFSALDCITAYLRLLRQSIAVPEISAHALTVHPAKRDVSRQCALIFSPHPDDECLTGALPLRLRYEQNWQIIDIAVTLGSNAERREARGKELAAACTILGFDYVLPQENGFSDANPLAREKNPVEWQKKVACIAQMISEIKPEAIFLPHALDAHPTHIGVHFLVMDALATLSSAYICTIIQTEYWHPQSEPNLMIGLGEDHAAKLLEALVCYAGENARNSYDATFPAYMIDNVRRGSERVRGHGASAAAMDFGILYTYGLWKNGKFIPSALKRIIPVTETVAELFA